MTTQPNPEPDPTPPDCPPCDGSGGTCPVDMAGGAVEVSNSQLSTPNSGNFRLTWYNRWNNSGAPANFNGGVGNNWSIDSFPYVTTTPSGDLAFVWAPGRGGRTVRFTPTGTGYTAKFGAREKLTRSGDQWRVTEPDGKVYEFSMSDELVTRRISPGGQITEYLKENGRIVEKRRNVGGEVESKRFNYNEDGNVCNVTLYRGTTAEPHQVAVRKAVFCYYETPEFDKGNPGDLKSLTVLVPGGDQWREVSTDYYRYYTSDSPKGFIGGLKYVVEASAYAELSDPENATDTEIASVATLAYEYDPVSRRATASSTHGGTQTFTIEYTESGNVEDYNHWHLKAVASLPNGATKTVFSNHTGKDIMVDDRDGEQRWITYTRFNQDGRTELVAQPSAIDMSGAPYNENSPNLNVQLNADKGLILRTTYYGDSSAAAGYPEYSQVQQGTNGPLVNVRKTEYESNRAGETTVVSVKKRIAYRSDTSGGSQPVETKFTNEFYPGMPQVRTITEHLPDVPTNHNGGSWSTDNTRTTSYDEQGRRRKTVDALGVETIYSYDESTGTLAQTVKDPSGLALTSNYESDQYGRQTKTFGPEHEVNGQMVRSVSWTIHVDDQHQTRSARGYINSSGDYTLVNPVTIKQHDASGRLIDEIQATRGNDAESPGELTATEEFPRSRWTRWTHYTYTQGNSYTNGRLQSKQIYHSIPAIGKGTPGNNYNQTDFGYDSMSRQNRVKSPEGTITRTVYDARGLEISTWVGTNDDGATDKTPSNASPMNNMKLVTENTYDLNAYGSSNHSLDGLLTKITRPVDENSENDRVVQVRYDWRGRKASEIATDGTHVFHTNQTIDNLGRVLQSAQYRMGTESTLIAKTDVNYDDRDQVYLIQNWGVNDDGTLSYALQDQSWYDAEGRVIKSHPAGSDTFTKINYDSVGRQISSYTGYRATTALGMDSPLSTDNDTIAEESHVTYDAASNILTSTTKSRWESTTGTGPLNGPAGPQPNSRDEHKQEWYDGIGRHTASADYGTNGEASFPTRPASPPASSDLILVSKTLYNNRGETTEQSSPAGQITHFTHDDAARVTGTIRNHGSLTNEEIQLAYDGDGRMQTLTAVNEETGNQVTTHVYGVTLADSAIASKELLAREVYPDGSTITYRYNRQGEQIGVTEANGTVHEYLRDAQGRQTEDKVVLLGPGIDGWVRCIRNTYDNRGRLHHVISLRGTHPTSGVTSDVEYQYDSFNQIAAEWQQHGGMVDTLTSPETQYSHADGSKNTIQRTAMTYPSGRVVSYDYGDSNSQKLGRIEKVRVDQTEIVRYGYLGRDTLISKSYVEPSVPVDYSLGNDIGSNSYSGMDRFGRITNLQWVRGTTPLVDLEYGYDRAGNQTHRKDKVARTNLAKFDELYQHDHLNRIREYGRGKLNSNNGGFVGSLTLGQTWDLDSAGNWKGYSQAEVNPLTQSRTHNAVNEITAIDAAQGTPWTRPEHNENGNMTRLPQPKQLDTSYLLTWDAWNRLVEVQDNSSSVARYAYDGLDRRIEKSRNGQTQHVYFSDQWQVIEERIGQSSSVDRAFFWGPHFVDSLIMRDRGNERLYALQDAQYNVVAIVDQTGSVKERFAYQPFGQSEELNPDFSTYSGSDYQWETRHTGRELDRETGLQIHRHRYLHPQLGRWCSRDPLGYVDGLSLYRAYFVLHGTDPNGLLAVREMYFGAGIACDPVGATTSVNVDRPAVFNCTKNTATKKYTHSSSVTLTIGSEIGGEAGGKGGKVSGKVSTSASTTHTEGEEESIELACCTAARYRYTFECTCNYVFLGVIFLDGEWFPGTISCSLTSEGWVDADVSEFCSNC